MRWWKRSKGKSASAVPRELSARGRQFLRLAAWVIVPVALGVGAWAGLRQLESHVMRRGAETVTTVRVAFTSRPEWMPISLARQIAVELVPPKAEFTADDLTANVYKLAEASPWVATVNKVSKRLTDQPHVALVEIDCRFRMPVARVHTDAPAGGQYAYVDAEAVRLPTDGVPQWMVQTTPSANLPTGRLYFRDGDQLPPGGSVMAVHYITISGVQAAPPPVGRPWQGRDIQDALRLVSMVLSRAYANQITTVDIRNYDGRISRFEPHLRMYAQVGQGPVTDIRFGRFPAPGGGDYEVSPEIKMSHLDDYFLDHGNQLAGLNSYIDLQYDHLIYSTN